MGQWFLSGIFSRLFFTHPRSACISDLVFFYRSCIASYLVREGIFNCLFSFLFLYHHRMISSNEIGVRLRIAIQTNYHGHNFCMVLQSSSTLAFICFFSRFILANAASQWRDTAICGLIEYRRPPLLLKSCTLQTWRYHWLRRFTELSFCTATHLP